MLTALRSRNARHQAASQQAVEIPDADRSAAQQAQHHEREVAKLTVSAGLGFKVWESWVKVEAV